MTSPLHRLMARLTRRRDGAERRSFPREAVNAPIGVAERDSGRRLRCHVTDISATGALLTPRLAIPQGEHLAIQLDSPAMTLSAHVVEDGERGTAVRFESPDQGAVLMGWLKGTAALQDTTSG